MKELYKIILLNAVAFSITVVSEALRDSVSDANNQFALNLYKQLSKDDDVFFSPISLHSMLTMIYQGADGSTKDALASTLLLPDASKAADEYRVIMNNLNNVDNVTLYIANKAYLKYDRTVKPDFKTAAKENFACEIEPIDFAANEAAANEINSWVSERTNEKIANMFSEEDFNLNTQFVLVNAVYFKGDWKKGFSKYKTKTETFYINRDDEIIDVQMMHRTSGYNYKRDGKLNGQVLELPFTNNGINMYIVLPNRKDGIANLEENIFKHGINQIWEQLEWTENLMVAIPKFKLQIEIKESLKQALSEMGLGNLFNSELCKLSGIVDGAELYVSETVQKTYIEVNEEGAEATATSGIVSISSGPTREEFYADHPFLVVIKDAYNVLVFGKVRVPIFGDSN